MPRATQTILVGACVAGVFCFAFGAATPAVVVLSSASLAGLMVARRAPADADQWFALRLLIAVTVGLAGWGARSQLDEVVGIVLIAVAIVFAALSGVNHRIQRRLRSGA
jgi:thiosulfate reductase cytochrome b subunit